LTRPTPTIFVVGSVVAVFTFLAVFGWVVWHCVPDTQRGVFGDMFGAANALFSGLAFAGIVYSLITQRHEALEAAQASERSARLAAISVLISALSERLKFLQSRAKIDDNKVAGIQRMIKDHIIRLTAEIKRSDALFGPTPTDASSDDD
jgi:hypothetical protein